MLNAVKIGSEFLINTTTLHDQNQPAIVTLASGGFVMAWADWSETGADASQGAIRAQLFAADGSKAGNEFMVNTTVIGAQTAPAVAALADGRFVIAWQDASRGPGDNSGEAVRAQLFNADGSRSGGEFVVPTAIFNYQDQPVVAGLSDGRFVFAWKDISGAGGDNQIAAVKAQIFATDGARSGGEFLVNTTIADAQEQPTITALDGGSFVIAWTDFSGLGGDPSNGAIKGQIYDSRGIRVGAEFLVNITTAGSQFEPTITRLSTGGFVVAWTDLSFSPDDLHDSAVRAQIFNADGTKLGGEFRVNSVTPTDQLQPCIAELPEGRFVAVWVDKGGTTATSSRIHAQVFEPDGTRLGAEFTVNTTDDLAQLRPAVTALADGRFVVTWEDQSATGGDTSGNALRAQIFDLRHAPEITSDGSGDTAVMSVGENATAVTTVTAIDHDSTALSWSIVGGADAAKFQIEAATGVLSFVTAPDFDAPTDAGANNSYVVTVRVSDGAQSDEQIITVNIVNVNEAPEVTSNGGGDSATIAASENAAAVTTVAGIDPDIGTNLQYAIVGGADAALFQIDPVTGALSFIAAPDFETPGDADHDNSYEVVVRVTDGTLSDQQAITIVVGGVNDAPVITSNGGASTASIPVAENTLAVTTVTATDADADDLQFSIVGGADAALFDIDESTGALSFIAAPDFEAPHDADHDNVYEVVVEASDGEFADDQAIALGISDVTEAVAPATKFGNEFLVNTTTPGPQVQPSIAAFASGQFVVAWTDPDRGHGFQDLRIHAQVFDADGSKRGGEIAASGATPWIFRHEPVVATLGDSRFVVAWTDFEGPTGIEDIHVQIFNLDGSKVGNELIANSVGPIHMRPSIAELAGGRFVVTWETAFNGTRAQVFEADGTKAGGDFQVTSSTADSVTRPAVTGLTNGGFVVTWAYRDPNGDQLLVEIAARVFNSDGQPVGSELRVNTTRVGFQEIPAVTSLADGRFLVCWADLQREGQNQLIISIRAQLFNADGSRSGGELVVADTAEGLRLDPTVATLPDGRVVVAWASRSASGGDTDGFSIRAQLLNADGTRFGDQFVVNTTMIADQVEPGITILADGRFVVTWTDESATGGDTSESAIRGQIFDPRTAAVHLIGTTGDDDFIGTRFADTMRGAAGDDRLDGAAGDDTAIFAGNRADYSIQALDDGRFAVSGGEGTDVLENFEHIQFADLTLDTDDLENGNFHVPQIVSDGGAATATVPVGENAIAVTTVLATDADAGATLSYAIVGGADASLFAIDAVTGKLSFVAPPDFEVPRDADHDNSYEVIVGASDGDLSDQQTIVVNVPDLAEPPIVKFGNEFLVNTTTAGYEQDARIAAFADGRFVATWTEFSENVLTNGVRAQIFNADGTKAGGELAVVGAEGRHLWQPVVTTLAGGRFVLAWSDQTDGSGQAANIRAQVFNSDGTKSGSEFPVNTTTAGDQIEPTISELAGGRFVVAWTDAGHHVAAQIFNADGSRSGGEFHVNATDASEQRYPALMPLADGGFIVTWAGVPSIRAQKFNSDGARSGDEIAVWTVTAGLIGKSAATPLSDGRFVVTWEELSGAGEDSSGVAVRAQLFNADGAKSGAAFLVNTTTLENQWMPSITTLRDGRFVAAWADFSQTGDDTSQAAIRAQVFEADGTKAGGEFLLNTTIHLWQQRPTIAALADGRFVAAWDDSSRTGDDVMFDAVRGQIFDPRLAGVNLVGTAGRDDYIGTAFADTMRGNAGDDQLDGAGGDDTAIFAGSRADYSIQSIGGGRFAVSGVDGSDVLKDFEHFQFADVTLDLETGNFNLPQIDSNGGAATATVAVVENATAVTIVHATDADAGATLSYAIDGGADASRFVIDPSTGVLRFVNAPDFENPQDTNHDNSYEVVVSASDGVFADQQTITVSVSDQAEPVGSEFLVNTTTVWEQNNPAIAALYSGQFVAAWEHYGNDTEDPSLQGIRLQFFNADGSKLGAELAVDATAAGSQQMPRVAALYNGSAVVTWTYAANDDAPRDILAQIFNRDGTKAGAAFAVANGVADEFQSTIAQFSDGRFAVAWAANSGNIGAQIFHADGTRAGAEFRVNTTTANAVSDPTVVLLTGGRFMLSWTSTIGGDSTVRAQIFRPDGTHFTDEFPLSPSTAARVPVITCLADGSFVAAWMDESPSGSDASVSAIRAQIFNFDGTTSGPAFLVNTTTAEGQYQPAITTLADGRFVVAWTDESATAPDTSDSAVRAQVFNPDGSRYGPEFVVNTTTLSWQHEPTITSLADGRFVVAWTDTSETGGDTSGDAVRGQIFDPRIAPVQLVGTATGDDFIGTAFDDTMFGGIGDDRLDGGAGDDLAIFSTVRNRYMIHVLADGKVAVSGFEGLDVLSNFEHFQFADMTLDGAGLEASNPHVPEITSDGGADAVTISVGENSLAVTTVTASDPDQWTDLRYSISGGADAGRFAINASSGALTFAAAPDFEAPADADHDNSYLVEVRATDGTWSDTQTLTVQVTDVNEAPDLIWLTGTPEDDTFTALPGNERIDALAGKDTVFFNFKLTDATVTHSGNQVIIDSAGSHTVLTGFERYVFTDGTVDNVDDERMVDDLFYYAQYHDVWNARVDADEHYQVFGQHEGRDPSAFFSTSLYLALNPDVRAAGVDPLVHFDQIGWTEGRAPSIAFDCSAYLLANPDVAAAQVDPLLHFLMFGAQEGRQPIEAATLLAVNGFDYAYYLQHNPDVAATHVDPLAHFEMFGWREGRNPNALFDTAGYLAAYADVAAAGINPFDHYNQFGWNEGRDPSVQFDTAQYLAHYADVAAAHVNPLVHVLHFGLNEGRSPFVDGAWG